MMADLGHHWPFLAVAAALLGLAYLAGLFTARWWDHRGYDRGWNDALADVEPEPPADWSPADEYGPGEVTGPFTITDLDGPSALASTSDGRVVQLHHERHERIGTLAEEEAAARRLARDLEFDAWEAEMRGLIEGAYEWLEAA